MGAKNTSLAREAGGSSELVMTTLGNLLGMKKDQKDVMDNQITIYLAYIP